MEAAAETAAHAEDDELEMEHSYAEERGRSSESLEAHVRSTKSSSGACWNEAAMELGTTGAVHV
jgi:hypothetical protein